VFQGAVSLEIYKDFSNPASGITVPSGVAVVVPPYLTFNETWYVRVKATGLTNYKITSSAVTIERPAWQMPASHNQTFGDSGTDSAGNPLPGDRGVDLQEDSGTSMRSTCPRTTLAFCALNCRPLAAIPISTSARTAFPPLTI
jgi:hypothetical protein